MKPSSKDLPFKYWIPVLASSVLLLSGPVASAQWTGATTGTGPNTTERNYLGTGNWSGGTINDTFSNAQTGALTVYFNGPRTTSGSAGVSFSGFGLFNESLTLGQNGFVDAHNSNHTLAVLGGGTFGSVAAAPQTLTLGGDLVNNNASSAFNSLTLGGSGNSALNINLGGVSRTFYSAASRPTIIVNDVTNGSVVKQGTGNLVLQGNNSITNLIVGRNNVASSITALQAGGRLSNTSDILVLPNASFRIDNQNSTPISRLNASGSMTLAGGTFSNQFNPTTVDNNYSDALGSLNIAGGHAVFQQGRSTTSNTAANDATITINLGAINRQNNAIFGVGNTGTTGITLGTNPALGSAGNTAFISNIGALESANLFVGGTGGAGSTTQKILTFASGQSGILTNITDYDTLVTYDATNGLRGLNLTTEYATAFGGNATDNVRLTSATTVATSQTANALVLAAGAASNHIINAGQTLNLTSGVLLNVINNNVTGAGTLNFGSAEGVIMQSSTSGAIYSVNMAGSGGLTMLVTPQSSPSTLSGDNSGLTGTVTLNARLTAAARVNVNSNTALGTANPLVVGANVTARIGDTGDISARVSSLTGGSSALSGRVELRDSLDSFVIGTGTATAGTLILDGASATTHIAPGMAAGTNEIRVGALELNGGASIFRNGDVRIDLFNAPLAVGSLAEGYSDLLVFGTSLSLDKGGDLKLSINSLYGAPALGTTWTIAVAGGAAGVDTITSTSGILFDSVTSGYEVSIGNYGTGTNNALLLTVIPEPSSLALLGLGAALVLLRRRMRAQS
jgi:hypothetical protein